MAMIHKLTKNGKTIFPATLTDAVVHPDTGRTLTSMIKSYNVSELFPYEGIDGGNRYDLALALFVLNTHLTNEEKRGGISITFISVNPPYLEEEYFLNKTLWSINKNDWGQRFEVGNVIADPSGSWEPGTAEAYIDSQIRQVNHTVAGEAQQRHSADENIQRQVDEIKDEIKQSDWNQTNTSEPDYIKNKPNLATVATSGSYNDLTDKPSEQYSQKVFLEENGGVLTQAMVNTANTIYVIQYDYTLSANITIPAGCLLEFAGGTIGGSEKTLTGNNTAIVAAKEQIFNSNLTLAGTWNVKESYVEWFGVVPNDSTIDATPTIKKLVAVGMPVQFFDGTYYLSECLINGIKGVSLKGTGTHYKDGTIFKVFNATGQRFILKLGGEADFVPKIPERESGETDQHYSDRKNAYYKSIWCSNFILDGIKFQTYSTTFTNADTTGISQNYAACCFDWCVEGYVDIKHEGMCPGVFIANTWEVYFENIILYGSYTELDESALYFGKAYTDLVASNISAVTINNLFGESISGKFVDCHNNCNIADLIINNVEFEPVNGTSNYSSKTSAAFDIIESNIRSMDVLYYFNFAGVQIVIHSLMYCGYALTYNNDTVARGLLYAKTYGCYVTIGKVINDDTDNVIDIFGAVGYAKISIGSVQFSSYGGAHTVNNSTIFKGHTAIYTLPATTDVSNITDGLSGNNSGIIEIKDAWAVIDKDLVNTYNPGILFDSESFGNVCSLCMSNYKSAQITANINGEIVSLLYFNHEVTLERKFKFNGTKLIFNYTAPNEWDTENIIITYYKWNNNSYEVVQTDNIKLSKTYTEVLKYEYTIYSEDYDYCTIRFKSCVCIESVYLEDYSSGGGEQVQSDWNQTNTSEPDYIKNKPNIPEGVEPSTSSPLMDGMADVGTLTKFARGDHRHPSDTSKQDTLVSGTNIKTINNQSILGSGNITIEGGGGTVQYTQKVFLPENGGMLTQEMVNTANTIYVIQYDYTLSSDITIPSDCMLEFAGGSLRNGLGESYRIISTNTYVKNYSINCISNVLVKNGFIPLELNANPSQPLIYTLECYGDFINDGVRVFCMAMNGTHRRTLYIDRDVWIDQSSVVTIDGGDYVDANHVINLCCQNLTVASRTNATITFTNNTNFYFCKYFRVKDIKIHFDSKTNTGAHFVIWSSNNVIIEGCEMSSEPATDTSKYAGGGIHILESYNIDIKNNYIHHVQMNGILVHNTCIYVNITNNRIDDSKNIGIEIEGRTGGLGTTVAAPCSNVVIAGNQVYNCTVDTAIHVNFSNHIIISNNIVNYSKIGINCISCELVDITNNTISVNKSGLLIWQEFFGDIPLKPRSINVVGNTIRASIGHNISGKSWTLASLLQIQNAEDIVVLGNNIIFTGSSDYQGNNDAIIGVFSSARVKVASNNITGNYNEGTFYNIGVLVGRSYRCKQSDVDNPSGIEGDCYDVKVVDNTLRYLSRAIATIQVDGVTWIDGQNNVASRLLIDGNSVDSCTEDARLGSLCSLVTIINNIVTNTNAHMLLQKGSTANRSNMTPYLLSSNVGLSFYDQTLNKPVWWNGSGWGDAGGGGEQVQSDWNQTVTTEPSYIKNKPNLSNKIDKSITEVNESSITNVNSYIIQECAKTSTNNDYHHIIKIDRSANEHFFINIYELVSGSDYKEYKVCGHITASGTTLGLATSLSSSYYKEYAIKISNNSIESCVPLIYNYSFDSTTQNLNIS